MKRQALFSLKDESKKLKCHLLQFLFGALRANIVKILEVLRMICKNTCSPRKNTKPGFLHLLYVCPKHMALPEWHMGRDHPRLR